MIYAETLRKLTPIINHAVRGLPEVFLVHQERCRYADNESTRRKYEDEKLSNASFPQHINLRCRSQQQLLSATEEK